MNPILRYAIYPFARVVELTRPKKSSKKEEPKDSEKEEEKDSTDYPVEEVILDSNGLETTILGNEYRVRLTRPGHGVAVHMLKESLERNRELLASSEKQMYVCYRANFIVNEEHNKKVKEKDKKALEEGERDPDKWDEKILRPGTQNALIARANIDLLIPLINMRGGIAEYIGQEALPINQHITALRNKMDKQFHEDFLPEKKEKSDAWTIEEFLITAVVVVIVALLLKAFI